MVADKDCFGERSVFAYLLEADAHCVGLGTSSCTFIHHVEQREQVPYRYFKHFPGVVIHDSGQSLVTARYYVRPLKSEFDATVDPLWRALHERAQAKTTRIERGPTLCGALAQSIARVAIERMRSNPSFLVKCGHSEAANLGLAAVGI
jgi:aminoglycoside N3'-acetyltransferase